MESTIIPQCTATYWQSDEVVFKNKTLLTRHGGDVYKATGHYGCVYFIKCGRCVKIGFASKLGHRISGLQTGSPHKQTLLTYFLCESKMAEFKIHRFLKLSRHRGEWFRLDDLTTWFIGLIKKGSYISNGSLVGMLNGLRRYEIGDLNYGK